MRLSHVSVTGAGLEVHAWASSEGIVAIRVGSVPDAGQAGGRPVASPSNWLLIRSASGESVPIVLVY